MRTARSGTAGKVGKRAESAKTNLLADSRPPIQPKRPVM